MEDSNKLLKDLVSFDPHFRQNAVRFLGQLFLDDNKRNSLKDDEKAKIVANLLTRLEPAETSLEVKGCTVKIFSQISKFLKEAEVIQIFSKIITYITDEKAIGKDIYVTCIKAIMKGLPGSSCYTVGKVIIPEITSGIQLVDNEIRELCFDAFNDYIDTFNYVLIKESESVIKNKDTILQIAVAAIAVDNESLRSKVTNFLGNFSVILNRIQMAGLLELLIAQITSSKNIQEKIAYLNTLNSVAKNSGNRHVDYISTILPIIYDFCNKDYLEKNMEDYDLNNDLVEAGLGVIETYIAKLTYLLKSQGEKIAKNLVEMMEFDPNYSYDMVDSNTVENYDGYGYDYDPGTYADDSSWKVRRSAVRVLHSFVKSRLDLSRNMRAHIMKTLIFNLREHDSNTKLDIVTCLIGYFRNMVIEESQSITSTQSMDMDLCITRTDSMAPEFIPLVIGEILAHITKDLASTNPNMKTGALNLLSVLALLAPNNLIISFNDFKAPLEACLSENLTSLMFFEFLERLLKSQKNCQEVTLLFDDLIKWIIFGLRNDYYKINIESLNTAYYLIPLLYQDPYEHKTKIEDLYKEMLPKFKSNDIDQELKLSLISSVGQLILNCGDLLPTKTIDCLFAIYLEKTKNENLRPLVFTWLIRILNEQNKVDLGTAIVQFTFLILELLGKNVLHIQFQTLSLLETIYIKCPTALAGNEPTIIKTLMTIAGEELLIPQIYKIMNAIVTQIQIDPDFLEQTLIDTLNILKTVKIAGTSLNALFDYLSHSAKLIDNKKIITHLNSLIDFSNMNSNIAKGLAIMASVSGNDEQIIKNCIAKLSANLNDTMKKNALTLLGDTCLYSKENHSSLLESLEKLLSSATEDQRMTISICMGKIGVADPSSFIEKISNSRAVTHYYFIAIREFLYMIKDDYGSIHGSILATLFSYLIQSSSSDDDKLRNICGECLGLTASVSVEMLAEYLKYLENPNSVIRATFYYGLKYLFNSQLKEYLAEKLIDYLFLGLSDDDLIVKQNAFNSLINFSHCFGRLMKPRYADLMNIFSKWYLINDALIDVVDIGGNMKIKNDKGLPIRKAIYSSIKILLDSIPEKINVTDSLTICLYGLDDTDDIQALSHGCLLKFAHLFPESLIGIIDALADNFKAKLDKLKPTSNQTTLDVKKKADLVNNIKRLFDELRKVQEIAENPKFVNLDNELQLMI